MNHTAVTGPNTAPTPAVPRLWKANRPIRIPIEMGTIHISSAGAARLKPSTAPSTEIAGVMTPSP